MNRLISISEAAKMLNVHVDTLREWDKKGTLRSVRLSAGSHRKYNLDDIESIIQSTDASVIDTHKNIPQLEYLDNLERKFKVNYPLNNAATYNSLVNYKQDLAVPYQRWCNYKEGYSLELNELIFTYYGVKRGEDAIILDPFSGSGSTLLAAKKFGLKSVGFEVNQFSHFFSEAKTRNYDKSDIKILKQKIDLYKSDDFWNREVKHYDLPNMSIAEKLFDKNVQDDIYLLKQNIELVEQEKVRNLLKFLWLACLEHLSNYRKAGNGLKIRKTKNTRETPSVRSFFLKKLKEAVDDLTRSNINGFEPKIYNDTSINIDKYIQPESIRGVIFSPPYANCFDYTEIYKVELWFGGFVSDRNGLKVLKNEALRSHLNRIYDSNIQVEPTLKPVIDKLKTEHLWSKKIPFMLAGYFDDMRTIMKKLYASLEKGGFCSIVVSNSAYAGVVVPTDLILASIAETIGFKINKIDVARYIITSSQQYEKTLNVRSYLRESIIYMEKK